MLKADDADRCSTGDWFDQRLRQHAEAEQICAASPKSAAWTRTRGKDGRVRDLYEILASVRNLARVQGVPKHCRVELAAGGMAGAAAAGFEDAPNSFERPFIFLDKRPYEACDENEVMDVYSGLVLHEAG